MLKFSLKKTLAGILYALHVEVLFSNIKNGKDF